jgi:hypothetical protein
VSWPRTRLAWRDWAFQSPGFTPFPFQRSVYWHPVVVHSVARAPVRLGSQPHIVGSVVAAVVYACATFAGVMHVIAAATGQTLPSSFGLTVLTIGLLAAIPALITVARRQLNAPRALWMATLAVVAVSALHLARLHGAQESWPVELIGHHASIVLAFAILYQDYRFALADLFLKHALTLLVLVALVFTAFSIVEPLLTVVDGRLPPSAIALLLALWAGTALLFPACRRAVARFVGRVVLRRADYGSLLQRLSDDVQQCDSPDVVLDRGCDVVASSLTATSVKWEARTLHQSGGRLRHCVRGLCDRGVRTERDRLSAEAGGGESTPGDARPRSNAAPTT